MAFGVSTGVVLGRAHGGVAVDRRRCGRRATVMMAGTAVENRAYKAAAVDRVLDVLGSAEMVMAAPLAGLTVSQVRMLKDAMPEGTKVMCVKNTLLRRAVDVAAERAPEGQVSWACIGSLTKQSNLWFFVEKDIKGTVDGYKKFTKDLKREEPIKGGAIEGNVYDLAGVEAIAKLPSKTELYQKIAVAIKSVPTKVGRTVQAIPSKVARAVKLATHPDEGSADSPPDA